MASAAEVHRWPRLVSVEGAAEYLSISASTVRGLDIATRQIGRRVLYDIRDLDRYVDRIADLPMPVDAAGAIDPAAVADEERRFFEKRKRQRGN